LSSWKVKKFPAMERIAGTLVVGTRHVEYEFCDDRCMFIK